MIALPLIIFLQLFSQGRGPIESAVEGAANSAEECKLCHEAEYLEWRGSRHSRAWTNDFFQLDYRTKKAQWCRNCHIPLATQQAAGPEAASLRDEGVNCIVCHVRGEKIFAKKKRKNSPHDTVESMDFGGAAFCEGCHQFDFPVLGDRGELVSYTDEPMQATVSQFREGPYADDKTCRDCHANSPGQHFYPGGHDLGMLRKALSFSVCRSGKTLRTTLTNEGAGHNVPTGDVHRHLLVKAWRANAPSKLQEAFYGRRFQPLESGGKTTIWDSSLPPRTYRQWQLDPAKLGGAQGDPVQLEVRYVYGSQESYDATVNEPAYQVVYRQQTTLAQLETCP